MADKVKVALVNGMHLQGFTKDFDEPILLDSDESVGGQKKGHRPMQVLLVALGSCMSMDTVSILRKKKQVFSDFYVEFDTEQAEEHPKIYTKIHMHFTIKGASVSEEAVARSLELSYTKYCPANAMLGKAAEITYSYEVIQEVPETATF